MSRYLGHNGSICPGIQVAGHGGWQFDGLHARRREVLHPRRCEVLHRSRPREAVAHIRDKHRRLVVLLAGFPRGGSDGWQMVPRTDFQPLGRTQRDRTRPRR